MCYQCPAEPWEEGMLASTIHASLYVLLTCTEANDHKDDIDCA